MTFNTFKVIDDLIFSNKENYLQSSSKSIESMKIEL